MSDEERAKKILGETIYITIATVSPDGQPWNTPVYAAYDDRYKFFWMSSPQAQHSRNIETNNSVFVVVFNSSQAEGTGEGVYMKGRAFKMEDEEEITKALKIFYDRKHKPVKNASEFLGDSPRRLYQFVPEKFWMNTDEKVNGFHIDGRKELSLR